MPSEARSFDEPCKQEKRIGGFWVLILQTRKAHRRVLGSDLARGGLPFFEHCARHQLSAIDVRRGALTAPITPPSPFDLDPRETTAGFSFIRPERIYDPSGRVRTRPGIEWLEARGDEAWTVSMPRMAGDRNHLVTAPDRGSRQDGAHDMLLIERLRLSTL
jgi:hypothetical protein